MRWQKSRVKLHMELVELDAGQGEFADQLEARFRQFKKNPGINMLRRPFATRLAGLLIR